MPESSMPIAPVQPKLRRIDDVGNGQGEERHRGGDRGQHACGADLELGEALGLQGVAPASR